ncbi:MAG: hypothetical protein XU11_C0006G0037 [Candidatus Dadabacteria bacterium CSP1-2]|nr:MAG: hypothetical protein XU11_C0006G0037 [Candidatus Dadabacteria bacterium CSP1-2]
MGIKNIIAISIFIICIITISLLSSGGCDLDFGGGGDGDGGNLVSIVQGTIISTPNSGITVVLINNNNGTVFESNPTDNSGNFFITGDFNGCLTLRLEFQDSSENVLAFTNVTVFPKTNVDLGNIMLENGNVILDDPNNISVNFDGNIDFTDSPETCDGGVGDSEGTIVVTRANTDITVQIVPTTNIEDTNNNPIGCDSLIADAEVEVTGTLQVHDTVLADIITLK